MKAKRSFLGKPIATIVLMALVVFIAVPEVMGEPFTLGETITAWRVDGYYYPNSGGGEFTLYPSAGLQPLLSGYVQGLTGNIGAGGSNLRRMSGNIGAGGPNFQSFCLEYNEGIDLHGGFYGAVVNDRAINGGVGPQGDPISKGTAYLYHQFQKGTLSDYDYNPANGRPISAITLQEAIWWLEGEIDYDPTSNYYRNLVVNLFGNEAMDDNDGQYPVSVLNLWFFGDHHQDVLIGDPVPEPATMLLLGSGLIGLAGLARRRFSKK